jgi:glycyl-tRNA synthetase beta subunit
MRKPMTRIFPFLFATVIAVLSFLLIQGHTLANNKTSLLAHNGQQTQATEIENTNAELNLKSLFQEHAALAHITTASRFDDLPDFPAASNALDLNGQRISQLLSDQGVDANAFLSLWREHNNVYIQYTDGLKEQDETKQQEAVNSLHEWTIRMAEILGDESVQQDFQQHIQLTKSVIDAHAAGNHEEEFSNSHTAFVHAGMMAEILRGEE